MLASPGIRNALLIPEKNNMRQVSATVDDEQPQCIFYTLWDNEDGYPRHGTVKDFKNVTFDMQMISKRVNPKMQAVFHDSEIPY